MPAFHPDPPRVPPDRQGERDALAALRRLGDGSEARRVLALCYNKALKAPSFIALDDLKDTEATIATLQLPMGAPCLMPVPGTWRTPWERWNWVEL